MRLDPLHVLIPLIVAALAVLVLALDTSAGASCETAQEQFDAGQTVAAKKSLEAIQKEEPDSDCAATLMAEVSAELSKVSKATRDKTCADAKAALKAHLLTEALEGFQKLLAGNPTSVCGTGGVADVVTELCDRAAVLAKHGAGEAANKAYTTILAIEPQEKLEPCPAEGLKSAPSAPGEPKTVVIQGVDGKDGTPGKPGQDGAQGKPGQDGAQGKPGQDGAPGKPGQDGAPGKPGKDGARGPAGPPGQAIVVDGKG